MLCSVSTAVRAHADTAPVHLAGATWLSIENTAYIYAKLTADKWTHWCCFETAATNKHASAYTANNSDVIGENDCFLICKSMLVMLPLQICSDHQMGYINSMKGVPPRLLPGKCCDMCERWLNHRIPRISFHTGPQSVRFWLCARARIYTCTVKWAKCSYTLLRHVVRIKKADGLVAKGWTDPWFSSKWQWGVLLF